MYKLITHLFRFTNSKQLIGQYLIKLSKYSILMQSFDFQFCSFLRVVQGEADFILYLFESQPIIYLKHYKKGQICRGRFDLLDKVQKEQTLGTIYNIFEKKHEVDIQSLQINQLHIILQIHISGNNQTLILPLELVQKVGKQFKKVENMYMVYRENYFQKEKNQMLEEISNLREKIQNLEIIKSESTSLQGKHQDISQLQKLRKRCKRLKSKSIHLNFKNHQLKDRLKKLQEKYNNLIEGNKNHEIQLPQTEQQAQFEQPISAINDKYIVHQYEDYTRIIRRNQYDIEKHYFPTDQNQICSKDTYNNQFNDYFAKRLQKKQTLTSQGFNQYIFKPFTIGKYINYFQITDRKIKFKQQENIYYHITSFDGIPLTGRTKVGFEIVEMSNNNIIVGIMLSIRKRLRYSFQHTNIVSYKIKGGKFGLYIDGSPTYIECEKVKKGECLWMIIDRQNNMITFQKQATIIKEMPKRFQTAALFPFITMKDQGDQVRII